MTNKVKLFSIFLVAVATFSVMSFFDVLGGVKSAQILDATKPLPLGLDDDVDQDGLSNSDESYWNTDFQNPDTDGDGFLDGEEVASRRDPTKPGPDDQLISNNITDKLANLAIGGLIEGSLKTTDSNFDKSVNNLALSIVDESLVSFLPKIEISRINTVEPTEDNQKDYIKNIDSFIEKLYRSLTTEINEIGSKLELMNNGGMANQDFIDYFSKQRTIFKILTSEAVSMPVPENWLGEHSTLITLTSQIYEVNDALMKGKDDPIKAAVGFNLFINSVENFPNLIQIFLKKAEQNNLSSTE